MEKKGEINKSEYCAEKKSRDGSGAASVGGRERGGRERERESIKSTRPRLGQVSARLVTGDRGRTEASM